MSDVPSLSAPTSEEQVRFLEAAMGRLDDAILVTEAGLIDPPGPRVVYANPAFAAMTGYELAEILGRSPRFLQGPKTERAELDRLRAALARDEPVRVELTNYTRHGVEFRVEIDVIPLRDVAGRTTHFLAIQRDVSGSRRSEQILARARRAMEQSSRGKVDTLAMASQEIRGPVNALLGFADLLFDSRLAPDQRDYLETIRSCGEDLLRLSNELLDLARMEAGRFELSAVPFEPLVLLQNVLSGFEAEIANRRIEITLQVDPAMPTHVVGDPARLRQILHSALGVLLRSVEHGKILIGIARAEPLAGEGDPAPGRFRLFYHLHEIEEGGAAIPARARPSEAGGRKTGMGGGLDLAVARRLAHLMGGGVETRAEAGLGSSFSFWVAVHACPAPAEAGPSPAPSPGQGELALLVVEDNTVNQKLLLALLKRLGYLADLAGHGGEALERLRVRQYDLILMDVQMPVMDGFQCTRRIRAGEAGADRAEVPIVAVTAGAMRGDREKCLEAGMNDYLSKPIAAQALQAVLEKVKAAKAARR